MFEKINAKFTVKEVFLSGAEITFIASGDNKKLLVSESDGNHIQRDYDKWDEKQLKEYKESLKSNFPHNPIYISSFSNKWYVVDGQHRVNAIKILSENGDFEKEGDISKLLFRFVLLKPNVKTVENHIVFGSQVFNLLNTTSNAVKNGAIYKVTLRSKDQKVADELEKKYKDVFKHRIIKGGGLNDAQTDDIFDLLGLMIFARAKSLEDMYDIKTMNTEIMNYLAKSPSIVDEMNELKKVLDKFQKANVYGNAKNIKTSLPTKNILIPMIMAEKEKNIDQVVTYKDDLVSMLKSQAWKKSKKNSRTPQALSMAAKGLINATSEIGVNEVLK